MLLKKIFIAFLFISPAFINFSFSQKPIDSVLVKPDQADTIIIIEAPYVIENNVYVIETREKNKKSLTPLYYYLQFGTSIHRDYYSVCGVPLCQDYFEQMNAATKPFYNNSLTAGITFSLSQKIKNDISISYSIYRDIFEYKDNVGKLIKNRNSYHYLETAFLTGYYLQTKKKKAFFLFQAGPALSYLTYVNAKIPGKYTFTEIADLKHELKLNSFLCRLELNVSLGIKKDNKYKYLATLYYSYDLISTINKTDFFTRQRNVLGGKIGIIGHKKKQFR